MGSPEVIFGGRCPSVHPRRLNVAPDNHGGRGYSTAWPLWSSQGALIPGILGTDGRPVAYPSGMARVYRSASGEGDPLPVSAGSRLATWPTMAVPGGVGGFPQATPSDYGISSAHWWECFAAPSVDLGEQSDSRFTHGMVTLPYPGGAWSDLRVPATGSEDFSPAYLGMVQACEGNGSAYAEAAGCRWLSAYSGSSCRQYAIANNRSTRRSAFGVYLPPSLPTVVGPAAEERPSRSDGYSGGDIVRWPSSFLYAPAGAFRTQTAETAGGTTRHYWRQVFYRVASGPFLSVDIPEWIPVWSGHSAAQDYVLGGYAGYGEPWPPYDWYGFRMYDDSLPTGEEWYAGVLSGNMDGVMTGRGWTRLDSYSDIPAGTLVEIAHPEMSWSVARYPAVPPDSAYYEVFVEWLAPQGGGPLHIYPGPTILPFNVPTAAGRLIDGTVVDGGLLRGGTI